MTELLLDAAGRRRSPATMPDSTPAARRATRASATRPTRRRSRRSSRSCAPPATASTAGGCAALIVVLWRAGLRIHEALALAEPDLDAAAARCSSAAARAAAAARSAWTTGRGSSWSRGSTVRARAAGRAAVLRHQRPDPRTAVVDRRRARRAPPTSRAHAGVRRRFAPHQLRHAARRRDGPRGRAADRHPAPARPQQPRHHLDLPPRHRQRRDHRHRPRPPRTDDPRQHSSLRL